MSGRRWRPWDFGVWEEVEADGPWCVEGGGGRCLGGGGGRGPLCLRAYASVASPNLTVFFCFLDVLTQLIVIRQVVFVLQLCNVQNVVIIPLFHYCLL